MKQIDNWRCMVFNMQLSRGYKYEREPLCFFSGRFCGERMSFAPYGKGGICKTLGKIKQKRAADYCGGEMSVNLGVAATGND